MLTGSFDVQGTFSSDCFVKIYENEIASAATTFTISSLTGNTDEVYYLVSRIKNDYAGATTYYFRFNNDSGANYGHQFLRGQNITVDAARSTGLTYIQIGSCDAQNKVSHSVTVFYAESGVLRTGVGILGQHITGTTVGLVMELGIVWNNSADEVTSIVILATQSNGLGVGSYFALYAKRVK